MFEMSEIQRVLAENPGRDLTGSAASRVANAAGSTDAIKLASVAMILRDRDPVVGPEVFVIRRARNERDPWSGHMAFPGGRYETSDATLAQTAMRETREETGIVLTEASRIGKVDDVEGRSKGRSIGLIVSCHVFTLAQGASDPTISINYESDAAFWIPLKWFTLAEHQVRYEPRPPHTDVYPGVRIAGDAHDVVWGLTYRFLCDFFARVYHPLPENADAIVRR